MSNKVKAADALFGDWYERGDKRLCCASFGSAVAGDYRLFLTDQNNAYWLAGDEELAHLPACTGWDWESPAPAPATSLAEDIEKVLEVAWNVWTRLGVDNEMTRILESARKWNEYTSNALIQAPTNDPDGVGEGYRELRVGDVRVSGYEYDSGKGWSNGYADLVGREITNSCQRYSRYRCRIDAGVKQPEPCPHPPRPKDAPTSPPPPVKSENDPDGVDEPSEPEASIPPNGRGIPVTYSGNILGYHVPGSWSPDYGKAKQPITPPPPVKSESDPDGVEDQRDKLDALQRCDTRNPDGVGEGWRLVREGEIIQKGDEYYCLHESNWKKTHDRGLVQRRDCKRRRRIDDDRHVISPKMAQALAKAAEKLKPPKRYEKATPEDCEALSGCHNTGVEPEPEPAKYERLVKDLNSIAKRCGDCGFVAVESAILKALAESEGE